MIAGFACAFDCPLSRSGSQTLPNTVVQGISVGSWNTKPSSCSDPAQLIQPLVAPVSPDSNRRIVDLPQPEGPSSERNSPRRTSRSTPVSATVPLAKVLSTLSNRTSRAAGATGACAGTSASEADTALISASGRGRRLC